MPATLQLIERERRNVRAKIRAHARGAAKNDGKRSASEEIPRPIKTLIEALGNGDLEAVVRVYREAMNAERRYWRDDGKDESGRCLGAWVIEPDHKTRIAAANMVAAYMEGLPVSRQMVMQGSFQELSELLEDMRSSGEAMRLLPAVRELPNESLKLGTDKPGTRE